MRVKGRKSSTNEPFEDSKKALESQRGKEERDNGAEELSCSGGSSPLPPPVFRSFTFRIFFPYTHFVPRPLPDSHSPIRGASAFQFLSGSTRRPWSFPLCSRRLQLRLFSHANRGSIRRLCLFTWYAVSLSIFFFFLFLFL